MPRTISTENPAKDVCRYLRHWGNAAFVEGVIQARHTGLTADQRRRKARSAALSILQGLEYLDSAHSASLLTRPLPLFYASENFAKAACIIDDPTLEMSDFKAHGLRGDKSRRYSIANFECAVQAPGSDVWSRAFRLLNADWIKYELVEDGVSLVRDSRSAYTTSPLATGKRLRFGELVRHIPELAHDVVVGQWGHPYTVPIVQFFLNVTTAPAPSHSLNVMLRHGHHQPTRGMIVSRETDLLRGYTGGTDTLDVISYSVVGTAPVTTPLMRCDVFGSVFMDFARGTTVLSEPLIFLASLFILSDVVRYQVDQWSRLLDDHPEEAILVERFLDLAGRKLPNLTLNELEQMYVSFKVGP